MHAQFCWSWYLGKLMIVSRCDLSSSQGFQFLESMYTENGIGILCKILKTRIGMMMKTDEERVGFRTKG